MPPKPKLKSPSLIEKRDGRIMAFDSEKITTAILKSGQSNQEFHKKEALALATKVIEFYNKLYPKRKNPPRVEEIQDIVEIVLMREGFLASAKAYILYRHEWEKVRKEKQNILSGKTTHLPFSTNALKVLANRYLKKDLKTQEILETPEQMFGRVARGLAAVEKNYDKKAPAIKKIENDFYRIMSELKFLPAGRTLTNTGTQSKVVSNCVVLHIDDSMESIFQTLKDAALLQQAGSGIGFPLHLMRPAWSVAERTAGIASGPVSFLNVYNEAFGIIKQQGRHGANMAVMRVDHPDILDFIHAKETEGEIKNFNISVALTDEFMQAVVSNSPKPWVCRFGDEDYFPRRIKRDRFGTIMEIQPIQITAKEIMDEIVKSAWLNGEPGVIFVDEVNRQNPLPDLGRIEACNPCGEQFLHDGDVCNLGSIVLDKFVRNDKIDEAGLIETTRIATRMLDNVIDVTDFPIGRVNQVFRANRRIGLGVMGFANLLFKLNLAYDSEAGRQVAERVMKIIQTASYQASQDLAKEKGVFPNWGKSRYFKKGIKIRNAALTTIAPTGSISMVADVSSGLEPYFALSYVKKEIMGGQKLYYTNELLEERLKEAGVYSEALAKEIAEKGSLKDIVDIPKEVKKVYVGAMDIAVTDHVRMQAAFQKYVDNSISKTINFPNDASEKDVREAYILAWELKCKSCTV